MTLMALLHGDCLVEMNRIQDSSVDMILCDLPYGTTRCKWDTCIDLPQLWGQYRRIVKPAGAIVLFAQTPFDKVLGASNLDMLRYEWVWEKTRATGHLNANRMPMKSHENILVFYRKLPTYNPQITSGHRPVNTYTKHRGDGVLYGNVRPVVSGGGSTDRYPRSVLKFPADTRKVSIHPTQKPVALLKYMIRTYTNKGDIVLDNCMGSGSTGVAAVHEGRDFIGIESDADYFHAASDRINTAIDKLTRMT